MGFTIETGISALTVFIQGLLSFFSPCVLPLVPLYLGYLSGGIGQEEQKTGGRLRLFIRVLFFCPGDQWSILHTWTGSFCGRNVLPGTENAFCTDRRNHRYHIRAVSAWRFREIPAVGRGTSDPLSSGEDDHVPGHCSDHGIYVQLCVDALCGTGADQRTPDGGKRPDQPERLQDHRSVYSGVYPAVYVVSRVHCTASRCFQETYECGQIHSESRRSPDDPYGSAYVYRKDE